MSERSKFAEAVVSACLVVGIPALVAVVVNLVIR